MPLTFSKPAYAFLQGGGEMGSLTRTFNWNETSLGSPELWPQSLRTTLGLLLHSAFPMFLFWGEELICFYNDAYRPSLGTNGKHPALGKPGKEVWPEIWNFIGPLIEQVMNTGEPVWFENQLVPIFRNGQLEDVYWTFSYSPAYGDEGEIAGVLVTCTETTAQVVSLKNYQESEARFGGAIQAVQGILWTNNAEGKMAGEQPGWEALTGQTYDEYQGYGWAKAVHPDDAQPTINAWNEAVARNGMFVFEHRVRLKTGQYGQFSVRAVPLRNTDGSIREWVGVHNDITAQVLAQQRIQQSQQQLLALFEQAPVAVAVINEENLTFGMANPSYGQLVGRNPADLIDKPLLEALPEISGQGFDKLLRNVLATGTPYAANEVAVNIRYGNQLETIYVDLLYQPRYNAEAERFTDVLVVATDVTKQVRSRKQVEASEAKLRSLITAAPVAIGLFVGRDLVIDLPNQTFIDIVGKGPDIVGRPLREVMPELITENQPFLQILDDVYTSGKMFQSFGSRVDIVQQGVMTHNYYNITYSPLYNEAGEVYAILDVAVDVTGQIQAQQALQQSEQKLRSLIESAPFPIGVYVGREMHIELANQSILDVWGKGNNVIGKRYVEILPELENQLIFSQLDDVYRTGIPFHAKNQRVDLEVAGRLQPYYFNYSFTPLIDATGQVYGVMNTAAEVTDLALAKQKVEEAEATLRGAVELAELGTWELDVATGQATYSDRIKAWYGFKANTNGFDRVFNPIHERDRSRVEAAIGAVLEPGSPGIYDEEYTVVDQQTGAERIVHAQGKTFFDAQGKPLKITGAVQDVTQDRRLQQELEQQVQERTRQLQELIHDLERSNHNLQQFAYVASHDLQEPLRKIQSFGDMLNSQYGEQLGESGRDFLTRMQASANRMSVLIKDLLTYSRISTRQDTSVPVQLDGVVQSVLQDLEVAIQDAGAVVEVSKLPTILGDKTQLRQLFQNLIGNALKFRQATSQPHIQIITQLIAAAELPANIRPTRQVEAYHRIDVSDNGIGFDQKYVDRIFQVFQRLHGKNEYIGTGIGLAICEKVATNHGGAITANSQPGKGATFSVYLPK